MKSFIEFIKKHNLLKIEKALRGISENDVLVAIDHYFLMPNSIKNQDKVGRQTRNNFFANFVSLLAEHGLFIAVSHVVDRLSIVHNVETVFDKIILRLSELGAQESLEMQVWQHVALAESSYRAVRQDIDRYKESLVTSNELLIVGAVLIETPTGHRYNPDAALEDIGVTLSLTLSMLSHGPRSMKVVDDKTIFPQRPREVLISHDAEETQHLAITWKRAEDSSYRAIAYGGSAEVAEVIDDGQMVKFWRIERDFSPFEELDLYAHERLNFKLLQNFSEILDRFRAFKWPLLAEVGKVENGKMLSLEEIAANYALDDILCFSIQDDRATYAGLTLREWIRGYSILRYVVEFYIPSGKTAEYSRKEMIDFFLEGGLSSQAAGKFLFHATFGKASRDLFDTPLLCVNSEKYFIFSPGVLSAQIPNVVLSRLASLKERIDKKGDALEKRIHQVLKKANVEFSYFKFKEGADEYEFDCVFIMDKTVFVVECKNRSLSGLIGVASYRKSKQLQDSIAQVLRLVDGLKSHPQHFAEKFQRKLSNFDIVPIVSNSMPISWSGLYEGVYLTDNSALSRFFRASTIKAEIVGTEKYAMAHELWSGNVPNASDLLSQLANPIQVRQFSDHLRKRDAIYPIDRNSFFSTRHLEIDHTKKNDAQNALFADLTEDRRESARSDKS